MQKSHLSLLQNTMLKINVVSSSPPARILSTSHSSHSMVLVILKCSYFPRLAKSVANGACYCHLAKDRTVAGTCVICHRILLPSPYFRIPTSRSPWMIWIISELLLPSPYFELQQIQKSSSRSDVDLSRGQIFIRSRSSFTIFVGHHFSSFLYHICRHEFCAKCKVPKINSDDF